MGRRTTTTGSHEGTKNLKNPKNPKVQEPVSREAKVSVPLFLAFMGVFVRALQFCRSTIDMVLTIYVITIIVMP